jgi:hypothetical protein
MGFEDSTTMSERRRRHTLAQIIRKPRGRVRSSSCRHSGLVVRNYFGWHRGIQSLLKFEARRPALGVRTPMANAGS